MSRRLATSGRFSVWWHNAACIEVIDDRDRGGAESVAATREEFGDLYAVVQAVNDKLNAAMVCQHGKRHAEWCDPCRDLTDGKPVWTPVDPE